MTSPAKRYVTAMFEKFDLFATWPPNTPLRLGDVGTLEGKVFKRVSSLKDEQIAFKERAPGPPQDWKHSSGSGVTVHAGGGAEGAGAKGSAKVDFDGDGAFLFQAKDCRLHGIENLADVGRDVLAAHQEGIWKLDWVWIDSIVVASTATTIISASSKASVELAVGAPIVAGGVALANADAGLSVASTSGEVLTILAARGATPLFGLSGLRSRFFRTPEVVVGLPRRDASGDSIVRVPFDVLPDDRWPATWKL